MPEQQTHPYVENNFSKGFVTEFTGLNFPPNATVTSQNVVHERIGDIHRRLGINFETNGVGIFVNKTGNALNTYRWKNVGGDGNTQLLVVQVGSTLYFFKSSAATVNLPLSTTQVADSIPMSVFATNAGNTFDVTKECQFADGQGFLFVYHPSCDPFFCTYNPVTNQVGSFGQTIRIRDLAGIPEFGVPDNLRPGTLSQEHFYNLINQGWTTASAWTATMANNYVLQTGTSITFIVNSHFGITPGPTVPAKITLNSGLSIPGGTTYNYQSVLTGGVVSCSLTSITISITSITENVTSSFSQIGTNVGTNTSILTPNTGGYNLGASAIASFFTNIGSYPANSDVWYLFKNSSGNFDPANTITSVALDSGPAPKGNIILNAFQQFRSGESGLAGLTDIITQSRPTNGCWFQGRVWYTGIAASQNAIGDAPYYTWTENIYFSQIYTGDTKTFSKCHQNNDPTSQQFFNILATDGGVIVVQGSGTIYKLFPVQNGLLIFAANGIWFLRGGSGLGFSPSDYTVTKISAIQTFSTSSFIDVQGYPYWWNEEGIYRCVPSQQTGGAPYGFGGFNVENLTFPTIQTFYDTIPISSKKKARGDYDNLNWIIRWVFKSTEAGAGLAVIDDTYIFDRVMCFNVITGAFYTYTLPTNAANTIISGLNYIQNPGGVGTPYPIVKYLIYSGNFANFGFAEEKDLGYVDFGGTNYVSSFTSAYKIPGQAQRRTQMQYLNIYSNISTSDTSSMSYQYEGKWDFAINQDTGKFTNLEQVTTTSVPSDYSVIRKRHRMRGRGMVYQFYIQSVDGRPFDIIGWSVTDKVNPGI